jgi:hypothetical protein
MVADVVRHLNAAVLRIFRATSELLQVQLQSAIQGAALIDSCPDGRLFSRFV